MLLRTVLVWCCLALGAGAQEPAYEVRTWTALADRDWSPVALRLRRAESSRWSYLESSHFTAAGRSLRVLDQAAREAAAAHRFAARALDLPPPDRPAVILLVGDGAAWAEMQSSARLRPDGESFQSGRELFLCCTNELAPGRVAHEMVHYLMRSHLDARMPLWLDEGLALHWGWQILRAGGLAPPAPRTLRPIPETELLGFDALTALKTYPDAPRAAQVFYRQVEEMTGALAARIGERALWQVSCDVVQRAGDWRGALTAIGWDAARVLDWEVSVREACMKERTTP